MCLNICGMGDGGICRTRLFYDCGGGFVGCVFDNV